MTAPSRTPGTGSVVVGVPAHDGPDVEALLIELARAHGLSEAAERSNHGLPPYPRSPVQGKRLDRA